MEIKVIGEGCEKCDKLYENTCLAVKELGLEASIDKVEDLMDIVRLGVMTTPSVMMDGKIIISGRVPKVKEIIKLLNP
ncbi:redox-active disulfide protein 2 [Catonella morbi ATCC 51271]|uniref:Redox-active disulfide protein 2 n=1 Tax=Catonella morbi ATCC 51271 TaxID=592026 RepID=V2Y595_9FIRM|nr:thioredoxin family protein [Catonella morbi]ESL02881.1 redox-active disulfide protein 2 [Catonella morbi ATCC 51271]